MPKPARKASTYVDFKAVKAAVSIEAVLDHYELLDDLEAKDDGYTGDCPFHEGDSQRPFHVSLSKNAWYCFGCEEGGNVLDFVARMEDVSIKKAAQLLAEWFEVKSARKGPRRGRTKAKAPKAGRGAPEAEEAALGGSQEPAEEEPEPAAEPADAEASVEPVNRPLGFSLKNLDPEYELLEPLGFATATVEHFDAGYCSKGMMKGRLAIPIHSPTGELLAYAGLALNGEGEYKFPPKFDRSVELYNLHLAIEPARLEGLVLVGDILDVWRLRDAGFPNAVALLSDELSPRQEALLTSFAGESQRVRVVLPRPAAEAVVARLQSQVWVRATELSELLS